MYEEMNLINSFYKNNMNLLIFGVSLPREKKIIYALPLLYGIGITSAKHICRYLGLAPQLTIGELTENQQFNIAKIIKENYVVEGNLEEQQKVNLQRYFNNGSIRGFRLRHGLPTNGQRTHSNAKTARRRSYIRKRNLHLKSFRFYLR